MFNSVSNYSHYFKLDQTALTTGLLKGLIRPHTLPSLKIDPVWEGLLEDLSPILAVLCVMVLEKPEKKGKDLGRGSFEGFGGPSRPY